MAEIRNLRKFVAPEFVFGAGARHFAGRYARNFGGRKILLVTDPGVRGAGWSDDVTRSLDQAGLRSVRFEQVTPNPRTEEVAAGADLFLRENCNMIVAIGGGSPIDCAKAIGIVAVHRRDIRAFQGVDQVSQAIPPLICIPTTGGTGADLSQFAIISNREEMVKFAIISKAVVPDVSLVDPETLITMDPYLSACTGLDALTHAIEAFVSNAHSPMTDLHALEAVRILSRHLVASVKNPADVNLRAQVMLGSLNAGLAFSNAILGATHAMSHSLGGYLDLAHGECNAILLDRVVDFNFDAAPERFAQIARALGFDLRGLNSRQKKSALVAGIENLKRDTGFTRRLKPLGVAPCDIPQLSRQAMKDPCLATNPRPSNRRDLETLYEEAL